MLTKITSAFLLKYIFAATEALGIYGEVSGTTNGEDSDGDTIRDFGGKVGVKFTF